MENQTLHIHQPSHLDQNDTDLTLLNRRLKSRQEFTLAKLAVRPAKAEVTRKRECDFWDYKQLEKLTGLIESHYATDKKVSFYSEQLNIKPRTLNRLTSFALGQTVYQLILDRRLKASREMLQDRTKIIKEIAYLTGFKSSGRFSRFFKEMTGMSAREFRRESFRQQQNK
ncbi:hypothetical protein ASU31_10435 [Pedobacter ginsenosidimutans]|uniref:HTH araC/xylS-type domain-containing protein n=1 Tax=Pedobacter ginsenosidimutans TaxID=687842 RepID=A0A0T5VQ11_9SPHI|nr:helix-turn-helix domain-containing protein [Pedobacter ginsenosidimutans]KRT15920.1 hypothetical protein ASU31_10435 [Pedobacter ginsenosidimutans]